MGLTPDASEYRCLWAVSGSHSEEYEKEFHSGSISPPTQRHPLLCVYMRMRVLPYDTQKEQRAPDKD